MKFTGFKAKADHIGMTASTICAIHCAIVPVLLTTLPLTGLGFLANPWLEWSMIILAILIGIYAIGNAYLTEHHRPLPLILLVFGFAIICLGHLFTHGWMEAIVVPAGGFLVAFAHFVNYKYIGKCRGKHPVSYLKLVRYEKI